MPDRDKWTEPNTEKTKVQHGSADLCCQLTSPQLRKRKETVLASLKQKLMSKKEIINGYAYQFPGTDIILDEIHEFIKTERSCCPFFQFELSVTGEQKESWLKLTGPDGTREFIDQELGF